MKYFGGFPRWRSKVKKDSMFIDIVIPKITTNPSGTCSGDENEEIHVARHTPLRKPRPQELVVKLPKKNTQNGVPSRSMSKEDTDAPWLMMDMMLSDTRGEADITLAGKIEGGSKDGMDIISPGNKSKTDRRVDLASMKKTHGSNRSLSTADVFHTKIEFDGSQLSNKPLGSNLFIEPSTNPQKPEQPKDGKNNPKNKFPLGIVPMGSWRSNSSSGSSIQKSEQAKDIKITTKNSQTSTGTLKKKLPFEMIRIGSARSNNSSSSTLGVDMEDSFTNKGPPSKNNSDWEQKLLEKMAEANTRHPQVSTLQADVKNFFPTPKQVPARTEIKSNTDSFFPSVAFPQTGPESKSESFFPSVAFPPVSPDSLDVSNHTKGDDEEVTKSVSKKTDDKQQLPSALKDRNLTRDGLARYPMVSLGADLQEQELRMNALLTKLRLQDGAKKDKRHVPVKINRKVSRKVSRNFSFKSTHSENSRSTVKIGNLTTQTTHSGASSMTSFHLFNDSAHSSRIHAGPLFNRHQDEGCSGNSLGEIGEEEAWSELQGQWQVDDNSLEDKMHLTKQFATNNMEREDSRVIRRVKAGIPYDIPEQKTKTFVNYEISGIHF